MHNVFAVFPDLPAAEQAVQRLLQAQFAQERIHLSSALRAGQDDPHQPRNRSVLGSLGGFWADLVLGNNVHEQMLTEAVRGGQVAVGVDAPTDELAQRARSLLRDAGALRLDERDDGSRLPDPPQSWHAADERKSREPVGTHSFTGSAANVGMPAREHAAAAEGKPHAGREAEPRAGGADLLGRTPEDRMR